MRKRELKTVITFYTTSDAFETEAKLKAAGISGRLIPVPREISAGCGLAWSMPPKDYNLIPENLISELPAPEAVTELLL